MNGPPSLTDDDPETDSWWSMFDPRRSLPLRVSLGVAGVTIVFVLLVNWITGTILRRQLEAQLGASFENLAFQVADKLDRSIYERYREILFTASLAPLGTPSTPVAERRRLLELLLDSSPDYAWIGFANPAGTVVFATKGQLEGTKVGDEKWFRNAHGKPYTGDAHEVPELAREMGGAGGGTVRFLDIAMPVASATGQFLGVLDARVAWSLAHEVQVSVVPVEAAQRDHIDVTLYSSTSEVLLDSGGYGWSEPPAPTLPDRKSRGFFRETIPNEGTYITGYAHSLNYREFRSMGWLVVVRQSVSHAFASVSEVQRGVIQAGLGFTAVAVVLAWFFAARLTQSFHAIGAAAQRIGAGDILTLIPRPQGRGEFQAMCAALNSMVAKFRHQEEKLETDNTRLEARLHSQDKVPKP